MSARREPPAAGGGRGEGRRQAPERMLLLFFTRRTSGPARRVQSQVAWIHSRERKRLSVVEIDADEHPRLVEKLRVRQVPALVLVRGRRAIDRLEGRVTGVQIEKMIRAHLPS